MMRFWSILCFLAFILVGCGLLGGNEEAGVQSDLPAPAPAIDANRAAAEETTPAADAASPRSQLDEPNDSVPPTYTPAPQGFSSGAPTSSASSSASSSAPILGENVRTHTVEAGETLGIIAEAYGVDLDDLIAVNHQHLEDIDLIYVGQVLVIPDP